MNGQARLKQPEFLPVSRVILPTRHYGGTHPQSRAPTQLPECTCVVVPNILSQARSQSRFQTAGRHPHMKAWPLVTSVSTAEDRVDARSMSRCSVRERSLSQLKSDFRCWLACALCKLPPLTGDGFAQGQFFKRNPGVPELPDKTIQVPKRELHNFRVHNIQFSHDRTSALVAHCCTNVLQIDNMGTRPVITGRCMRRLTALCARKPQISDVRQFLRFLCRVTGTTSWGAARGLHEAFHRR